MRLLPAALALALALLVSQAPTPSSQSALAVPPAPFNLTVKKVSSHEIHLTWANPPPALDDILVSPVRSSSNLRSVDVPNSGDSSLYRFPEDKFHYAYNSRFTRDKQYQDLERLDGDNDFFTDDYVKNQQYVSTDRHFHKKKRRRDITSASLGKVQDSAISSTDVMSEKVENPTSKKSNLVFSAEKIDVFSEATTEQPLKYINYVLFYEEGYYGNSSTVWRNSELTNDLPEIPSKVHNITLTHDGKDGSKGVKFTLRGLKSFTYYRIWVRAFYVYSLVDTMSPPASSLSPPSFRVTCLTDVIPPSVPFFKNITCDQPPGTLVLQWSRPEKFDKLDYYFINIKLLGSRGNTDFLMLNTSSEHLETYTKYNVMIFNNISTYEVAIQAAAVSVISDKILINGTRSEPYQVIMTPDCTATPLKGISLGKGEGLGSDFTPEIHSGSTLAYMLLIPFAVVIALSLIIGFYQCGCVTIFKKCYPMSYFFLEEGGAVGGSDCSGELGNSSKIEAQTNCTKANVTSPTHAVIFWGGMHNGEPIETTERLWDALHPPVLAEKFLAHTTALHADGDIGFSKEYELIQSKSSMLGHTSHHSQHPDNRHKNRYLNITAYDHSRVCLLPSSSCSCDPGREHRKSCTIKNSQVDTKSHCDYVNANFIDGIIAKIDANLAKFIIEQNLKRKAVQKKKPEVTETSAPPNHSGSDVWITLDESQHSRNFICPKGTLDENSDSNYYTSGNESKSLLSNFSNQDNSSLKNKLSLDLDKKDEKKILSPSSEILANACRLSINLDRKDDKPDEVKIDRPIKEVKNKKRSTSADTRDIVIDKKSTSRGHSKNSSVVVTSADSPSSNAPKIECAFLNIEFSGIIDSEREYQKAKEIERLNEVNKKLKETAEETLDDLDDLYIKIDGESYRINSSWLLDRRRYIGTQGPTPGTLPAFWRMVWDHNVAVIVMITNLVERGRRKCDMYWPKEGTEIYGLIQVSTLKEDVMATYTVRNFQIRNTKMNLNRTVLQYHYTVWPDHGTPEHPLAVLRFREAARRAVPPEAGTILVHCSAGVGRTGTYIVLDAMLNHLRLTGSLNVFSFLCHVRTQRNFLVQTEEQYVFIHDALLEAIQSGDTEISAENIKEYLKKLLEPLPKDYVHESLSNIKCGLYGAPLNNNTAIVLNNEEAKKKNNEDCDFVAWNNLNDPCYKKDKTLEECKNDIVSVALQELKPKVPSVSDSNVKDNSDQISETENSVNMPKNQNHINGNNNFAQYELDEIMVIRKAGSNDTSPELVINEIQMEKNVIDSTDETILNNITIKRNSLVYDKNMDIVSVDSINIGKCNNSSSFDKLNGVCSKTSEESKASSISNEEIELSLNENNSNYSNKSGKNASPGINGQNSNTITSSVSSNTHNPNQTSFKNNQNNSPLQNLNNQEYGEFCDKNKYRNKHDDNYELLSGSSHPGGLGLVATDYFAGSHQFSCQKKNLGDKKPRNLLERQFKLVTSFEPNKFHLVSACKQVNVNKNRPGAVLPIESGRVHLIPKPGIEGTDYINATWLQGHRSLREYVVTQHPLPHTIADLYRLLWDHSCQIIIVLTDLSEDSECQQFWPTEKDPEMTTYNYGIHFVSEEKYVAKQMSALDKKNENSQKLLEDNSSLDTPLQSPSSGSSKGFSSKSNKNPQRNSFISPYVENGSHVSEILETNNCINNDEKSDNSFYRRQFSSDNQDEEKLIPQPDDVPSLDCMEEEDELKKLNAETKSEGYTFDKSELCVDQNSDNTENKSIRLSPINKRNNGDVFSSADENSKKSQKSPSKISLKNFKINSPVLRSPTKFKFDFGSRMSGNSGNSKTDDKLEKSKSPQVISELSFEPKFGIVPLMHMSQLREGSDDIGLDCVITTTNITMNSLQDDYELKIKLIECPKWLADLDYDEHSDTDDESEDDDYEIENKALDFVIDQRLKSYRGVFALPEYVVKSQEEAKNSPVVVIDKYGGARAVALCTLSSILRKRCREIYSYTKLHHGRRAGAWRRPSDIRALYEALAAYECSQVPSTPTYN